MEELKQLMWRTKFEVETIRGAAQDEIGRKDDEINQLKELLNLALKERDEAVESYQSLLRQQQRRQSQQDPTTRTPPADDDGRSEESIVCESTPAPEAFGRPLPEKGKLLQAVMKAGPLLQTLLLAGPLPQWRHPPPPLDGAEIPPVVVDRKRGGVGGSCERGESSALLAHLQPCIVRPRSEVVRKQSPFLT